MPDGGTSVQRVGLPAREFRVRGFRLPSDSGCQRARRVDRNRVDRNVDGPPRRKDAQRAGGLLRVDPRRQVMGLGAGLQLAQGLGVHTGMPHVQFENEVMLQVVGALHHNVKGLDAVNGDVALGKDLGFGVVEVYMDNNAELVCQGEMPSLRGCDAAASGRDSAATIRLGRFV
jgi:hypothetical protein